MGRFYFKVPGPVEFANPPLLVTQKHIKDLVLLLTLPFLWSTTPLKFEMVNEMFFYKVAQMAKTMRPSGGASLQANNREIIH